MKTTNDGTKGKKLELNRETLRVLRVRSDVRTGGATLTATGDCKVNPFRSQGCNVNGTQSQGC